MKAKTFFYNSENKWADPLAHEMDSLRTLVIAFCGTEFIDAPQPFHDLKQAFPNSIIIGCSTAGEILGRTLNQDCITGAVVQFDKTRIQVVTTRVEKTEESLDAGKFIAEKLKRDDLASILILSGGLNVNGSEIVQGINSQLPESVIVTGGLAGDKDRFSRTWALNEGLPEEHLVSAVGFYGENIKVRHGSKGGWDIFGPERRITKSIRNQLFELDGKPALELYKSYLGERAAELPASALLFPLGLRINLGDEKRIVRTILTIDELKQSLTFAGDVPEGAMVQLMRANFDRLIDGATAAAEMTEQTEGTENDILSLAISCVGRRLVLGERVEEELDAVMDVLPPNTKQIGFYSYGEISPYKKGFCDLHNQTMTLTTITEE